MRLRVEARARPSPAPVTVLEVTSPRTNAATFTPAEHLFAALAQEHGLAFELAADQTGRRFLVRAAQDVVVHLGAAYPQARVRPLVGGHDPAVRGPDEQAAVCALGLRAPDYLPLRVPRDPEVAADRAPQADPLLGVLAALGGLPAGWRGLVQLVLHPAPADWARAHLRRTVEPALAQERAADTGSGDWGGLMIALLAVLVGPRALALYRAGAWPTLIGLGMAALLALVAGASLWQRLTSRPLYDLALVRDKLSRPALRVELRLAVFAPATVPAADLRERLARLAAAYRAYDLERGNGLARRRLHPPADPAALARPVPVGAVRSLPILNVRELAALWHLLQGADDVPLVERTTARRLLPLPATVSSGLRLGTAEDGLGHRVPVHLAPALLRRHALLVAKTRKGKSGLLQAFWRQLASLPESARSVRPTVVLVDPHSDLAQAVLGLVPPGRQADVVHLDVGGAGTRPFGLNLLDVGLGWDRDLLVEHALRLFRYEFTSFWGPRMELVFRLALLLLVESNARIVAADPTGGRDRQ